jgi:hypothetical protein
MTAPDREAEFEAFLKRRTLLPNIDEPLEPPGELDDSVLKQARAAIQGRRQQPSRPGRWAMPVALAATILLCLSVVLNVKLNTNRPTVGRPSPAPVAGNAAPAPPPAAADKVERYSAPATGAVAKADSAVAPQSADGPRADVSAKPAAPAAAPPAVAAAPAPEEAPASPAASAPRARSANAAEPSRPQLAKRAAESVAEQTRRDPKTWLEQISALRAQGKIAEADAEMQRFRASFPAYRAKSASPPPPGQPK